MTPQTIDRLRLSQGVRKNNQANFDIFFVKWIQLYPTLHTIVVHTCISCAVGIITDITKALNSIFSTRFC